MSELTDRVRRMLVQAQQFEEHAPLEAVERATLAISALSSALQTADQAEAAALRELRALAEARRARYQAALDAWTQRIEARAQQYQQRERDRLGQPLPAKV